MSILSFSCFCSPFSCSSTSYTVLSFSCPCSPSSCPTFLLFLKTAPLLLPCFNCPCPYHSSALLLLLLILYILSLLLLPMFMNCWVAIKQPHFNTNVILWDPEIREPSHHLCQVQDGNLVLMLNLPNLPEVND